jgi:hypothetical protein
MPADVVNDPELEGWLRLYERARPDEGRTLRACREAWLFLGVKELPPTSPLEWQLSHLRKHSPLLTKMTS